MHNKHACCPLLSPSPPALSTFCRFSCSSRGYVKRTYTWKHHYWFLTNEGITYLREYLNFPETVVPNTHKKQQARPSSRPLGDDRGDRPRFGQGPGGDRPGGRGGFGRGGDREG